MTNLYMKQFYSKTKEILYTLTDCRSNEFNKYVSSENFYDLYRRINVKMKTKILKRKLSVAYLNTAVFFEGALNYFMYYPNSTKFIVESIPDTYTKSTKVKPDFLNAEPVVFEFEHKGKKCVGLFVNNKFDTVVNGVNYKYTIMVFVDDERCIDLDNDYPSYVQLLSTAYRVNISEDGCNHLIEYVDTDSKSKTYVVPEYIITETNGTDVEIPVISDVDLNSLGYPPVSIVIGAFNYANYCYNNRKVIHRKSTTAGKHYAEHKVSTISKDKDSIIPLVQYVTEYEPGTRSEYKGGHHASPVEHDRRGHFRRTKNHTGNWNYIDGKFVESEPGKGEFTLVKGSHVNGKNKTSNGCKIYKTY